MQEAMTESKARKFYLYSGHDYTGRSACFKLSFLTILIITTGLLNQQRTKMTQQQRTNVLHIATHSRVAKGQGKNYLGKVREFYFKSGKINFLEKNQKKLK